MTWAEVASIHRGVTGISVTGGVPTSILCNPSKSGPFPDEVGEARLIYYVNGPSKTMYADKLIGAVGSGLRVKVFQKIAMNDWRDLGEWTPTRAVSQRLGYVAVEFCRC